MAKSRSDDEAFEDDDRPVKRSKPSRPRDDEEDDRPARKAKARDRDDDDEDDRPRKSRRRDDDEDDDERPRRKRDRDGAMSSVIPYRNGFALTAYYCSFFSLISILGSIAYAMATAPRVNAAIFLGALYGGGGLLGLLAIVFGIIGLMYVSKHPKAKGTGHAITGLILGSLCLIGLVVITLMGMVAQRH